ncbi:hypothetical protein BC829DRAFT_142901 [Chytridium lagenaria]|nr:hypothetical protein BC829DRAFT_142901 [Chytridium lagenaria]
MDIDRPVDGRPKRVAELSMDAQIDMIPSKHTFKAWCSSASRLIDQGYGNLDTGDLENAYILLFRAISIIIELVPRHPDFNPSDPAYSSIKHRAKTMMNDLESLKKRIEKKSCTESRFSFSAARKSRTFNKIYEWTS